MSEVHRALAEELGLGWKPDGPYMKDGKGDVYLLSDAHALIEHAAGKWLRESHGLSVIEIASADIWVAMNGDAMEEQELLEGATDYATTLLAAVRLVKGGGG
ncbi:MAG: hypothetical protein DWQ20_00935 [Actinobacteria bacterium]|nr:MAG: hypothetical protein DWQ20_00935 [Actinomycetota bacterium]